MINDKRIKLQTLIQMVMNDADMLSVADLKRRLEWFENKS
jgi:hypothetical protein